MHGSCGGECGNTLWHGSIFPKGACARTAGGRGQVGLPKASAWKYHKEFKPDKLGVHTQPTTKLDEKG